MSRGPSVRLGFAVGTGESVDIPLRHMVVTGQTQEAGKTTTLEALIARSGVKAVAFVTKRGEGSFTDASVIPPYFREQADWQFVASILEASRGEKLKFERSWIMRAAKGAKTLADVQRNVRQLMAKSKRSMDADMYMVLDAYLDVVVPQIEEVQWAKRVVLATGLNVMDLTPLHVEMQHLVIRSTIDWVLNHETDTVVVVPEAWKFIPQGRGTPVKLAAESYIRQAAGLRNYLWLDSQDIAGVEKMILKSVPVWILGVQRESNEVKRTLDQIPAGIAKPKAVDIATLGLGEFIACYGKATTKVYVQPEWLSEKDAIAVACGMPAPERPAAAPVIIPVEDTVKESEARELREENERLRREIEALKYQLPAVVAERAERAKKEREAAPPSEVLEGVIDEDALYQRFKQRLAKEAPAILRVLTTRPELEVTVTRKTITADENSLKGRIARLLKEGFFADPKSCGSVRAALKRTGPDANTANIGRALDEYTRDGFVTDEGSGYRAVEGMKINIIEG